MGARGAPAEGKEDGERVDDGGSGKDKAFVSGLMPLTHSPFEEEEEEQLPSDCVSCNYSDDHYRRLLSSFLEIHKHCSPGLPPEPRVSNLLDGDLLLRQCG